MVRLDPEQLHVQQRLQHVARSLELDIPCAQGLYIEGPVGRGKSMLMNEFFSQLSISAKVRLHYHHFMRQVHQAMADYAGQANPLWQVATEWARRYRVICLDEFMVEDIADAMILGTLWRALFALDVLLVTTSNTTPDKLYENGLQRERFLPAIDQLKTHCEVVHLDGGVDYRMQAPFEPRYYQLQLPLAHFKKHLHTQLGKLEQTNTINVLGRDIGCLGTTSLGPHKQAAVFDFAALCDGPRSQRDYMELASRYQAIAVHQVPAFSYRAEQSTTQGIEEAYQRSSATTHYSQHDNQARRFIALVDECYDRNCLLLINAAVPPWQLYQAKQLQVPFERCSSRLVEMQSWPLPSGS